MIAHRSYIVAEIPDPVRSKIQALRDSLNTSTAKLPVEITLAGSSGVGPIPVGTDLSLIEHHLERIFSRILPFRTKFSAIRRFPNTSIFYLEPFDRSPFDYLHQELRSSGITFTEIPWPYNPHCTLRSVEPLSTKEATDVLSLPVPEEEFWIHTISVYHLDDISLDCKLLWQRSLGT